MKEWHATCIAIGVIALAAFGFVTYNSAIAQDVPYIRYVDENGFERKFWNAELLLENTVPNTVTKITFQSHPDANPSGVMVNRTHVYATEVSPVRDLFDVDVSSRLVSIVGDENTIAEYQIVDIGEDYKITKVTGDESTPHFVVIIPKDRVLSFTFGDDLF